MKVSKIRITNFQCIRDSEDILLDDQITVLIGENESGKSAILKALSLFNKGDVFKDVDISTMSGIRPRLDTGELSRDAIEMVSIWLSISQKEKRDLGFPEELTASSTFKIIKTLDNNYKVLTGDGKPLSNAFVITGLVKIKSYLESLQSKVKNIYSGQVIRKRFQDKFVFLKREENEPPEDHVILYEYNANDIWNDLKEGDWLQVTNIAEVQ